MHLADLRASGLSDDQIRRCGFRSETDPAQVAKLLNWESATGAAKLGPCLCIPFVGPDGKFTGYVRVKPDRPREKDGKKFKYESPVGKPNRVYFPPDTLAALADPAIPLLITEGEKKAAKADQDGFPCLGLVGVYGWQKKRPKGASGKGTGPRELIADLAKIIWTGRRGYIVFDSDLAAKPEVRWAEWHLTEALRADVLVVRLPAGPNGEKVGLDDFLVAHGADALRALLAAAGPAERPLAEPDTRPELVIGTDEHRVNAEATAALGAEPDVYQRGGLLVHVLEQERDFDPDATIRRPAGAPAVRELARPLLRERLTRCARWVHVKQVGEGEETKVPAHPPDWCVGAVHARGRWPGVRRLTGLLTHPVVMPDGSILTDNGYHPGAELLACLPPDLCVSVPDRPNLATVNAAVVELSIPVADFPFEEPAHKAALIAGLLTPLAWYMFEGPAPLFLIDKNVRGAGAGLLADVVALTMTGRRFPVMSYTNDREELRKKITTLAIEEERLILLDNLAGAVGNDVLDAALTADTWKDRVLGSNKVYDGPLHVVWFGTGNNVQLHADTARRVCHIRMESADERPETRTGFKFPNLREHVRKNRGKLLSAALTVLRGWIVAGRPTHGLTPWGSFEGWSGVVREAVVFAGLPDSGETRLALQTAADRDAAAMADIITGLAEMDPDRRGLTAAEIVARLKETDSPPEWMADMRAAVEELCGKLDARPLGYKFRHFARRNFKGRVLDRAGEDRMKGNRWAVYPVSTSSRRRPNPSPASPPSPAMNGGAAGDAGDAGDAPTQAGNDPEGQKRTRRKGGLFASEEEYRSQMLPD